MAFLLLKMGGVKFWLVPGLDVFFIKIALLSLINFRTRTTKTSVFTKYFKKKFINCRICHNKKKQTFDWFNFNKEWIFLNNFWFYWKFKDKNEYSNKIVYNKEFWTKSKFCYTSKNTTNTVFREIGIWNR